MAVFGGLSAADFLSDADTRVSYSKSVTKEVTKKSKMQPFIARSEDDTTSVIRSVLKTCELGSIVGVEMEDALVESGAIGNVDFSASGEELKQIKQFIKIDRFQHAVPSTQSIVNQRNADTFKSRSKRSLSNWGTMKFDKIAFSAFTADSTNMVICGHHADATPANLISADVLTTADVEEAKRRALLGLDSAGNNVPPLLPIHTTQNENLGYYDEVKYFIMWVGTNSARNIKNDANWEAARKDALERGKSNPIFSGALGFWDGVLLLDGETDNARQSGVLTSSSKFNGFGNVKTSDLTIYAGGAGQETEINLLVGAGAGYIVVDQGIAYYDWVDKSDPRRMNAGIDRVYGFAKTKYVASLNDGILADSIFDGKDYGVITVVASTGI
jgi:N4-gp56 family major capsid protein